MWDTCANRKQRDSIMKFDANPDVLAMILRL